MFDFLGEPSFYIVALAGFFGGVVRGYSGFGFALAAVPILTIGLPPSVAVSAVFPLELAIGLLTLPSERKNIDFRVLRRLTFGAAIGTPFGVTVLRALPTEWMRILIGLAVAAAVVRA
ncbi:MAG: sulfite exporter TauE/SafE family protein, partial [Candidatus Methylopumilus sp.]